MTTAKFKVGDRVRFTENYALLQAKRWRDPVEITHVRNHWRPGEHFYRLRRFTKGGKPESFIYEVVGKNLIPLSFGKISLEEFL